MPSNESWRRVEKKQAQKATPQQQAAEDLEEEKKTEDEVSKQLEMLDLEYDSGHDEDGLKLTDGLKKKKKDQS